MGTSQRGSLRVKSDSWYGYFNVYDPPDDLGNRKRHQKCIRIGDKSLKKFEAYEKLQEEIKRVVGVDGTSKREDITFKEFAVGNWKPLREGKWRTKASRESAALTLKHIYEQFGNVPLVRLDRIELQKFLNKLAETKSRSLVQHCRSYLKAICGEAVEQDFLRKDPSRKLEMPHTKAPKKVVLTLDQFNNVLDELSDQDRLMIDCAMIEALRPGELLALRWNCFDPQAKTFTIRETAYKGELRPFTKNVREGSDELHLLTVVIPDALAMELELYREGLKQSEDEKVRLNANDDAFIFPNSEGGFQDRNNFLNRVLTPVRKKLKLPMLNFQVLRRTMATISQHDGSVKDVQSHLRHRKPTTTAGVYMQTIPESTRKMVNTVYEKLKAKAKAAE